MNPEPSVNNISQAKSKAYQPLRDSAKGVKKRAKCHFISNTHWDREWRFSMQRTRHMLVYMMDMLLDIFEKEPQFKSFHLDSQTIPLKDYLEVRPEKTEIVKRLVTERRLLVGPWFCLPDEFCVSGESLIRNLLLGHKIAKHFGHVSKTGYSPFSWGQISQMPQIYKGFDIKFAAFYRGVNTIVAPRSEFFWEGADGTCIVASRLARRPRYNIWYLVQRPVYWGTQDVENRAVPWDRGDGPFKLIDKAYRDLDAQYTHPAFRYYVKNIPTAAKQAYKEQEGEWTTDHRLWSCGHDSSCPDIREVWMIRDCNKALKKTAEVFHSTFEDFQKAILANVSTDLPRIKGEMRYLSNAESTVPLFGWVISARMDLKQDNFRTERELTSYAEPLTVFASLLGADYPQEFVDIAYNWLLQNHGHDSIGGCSKEIVGQDMLYRTRQTREISSCLLEKAMMDIVGTIDFKGKSEKDVAVVVYNPACFQRSETIAISLNIPTQWNCKAFALVDSDCKAVPIQVCGKTDTSYQIVQSPNDCANMFEFEQYQAIAYFEDVPSMGYKTFMVRAVEKPNSSPQHIKQRDLAAMENEYLVVEINDNGTLKITDKDTGITYDRMGYFRDSSEIGNPWQHTAVENESIFTTIDSKAKIELVRQGPLETAYKVMIDWALPKGRTKDDKSRSQALRLYPIVNTVSLRKGQPWVEIETEIDNTVEDHYLQVTFPTGIKTETVKAQGQFDVVERNFAVKHKTKYKEPAQTEQPMNSFVDVSDGRTGVALLNEGLKAYEACNPESVNLSLTLLRCFPLRICITQEMIDYSNVDKSSHCPGKHGFRYAVMPHAGDWAQAELWQAAERFNLAFIAAQTAPTQKGTEPLAKSFLEIDPNNWVYVSAIKRSESGKGWVVRLFNPFDKTVCTRIRLNGGLAGQQEVFSPVEQIKAEMALPAHRTDKWTVVREVTLEEVPQKQLDVTDNGWCKVELTSRKIVTLQFIP